MQERVQTERMLRAHGGSGWRSRAATSARSAALRQPGAGPRELRGPPWTPSKKRLQRPQKKKRLPP